MQLGRLEPKVQREPLELSATLERLEVKECRVPRVLKELQALRAREEWTVQMVFLDCKVRVVGHCIIPITYFCINHKIFLFFNDGVSYHTTLVVQVEQSVCCVCVCVRLCMSIQ